MAERALATAYVNLVPSISGKAVEGELGKLTGMSGKAGEKSGKGFAGKFGGALKGIAGPLAAAISVGAAVKAGKELIRVGEAAGTSNARIAQINESMGLFGDNADTVNKRLIDLARTQALATGADVNSIKQTQAKLLTFGELAKTADTVGGAFDRATAAAIDLEAAGFGAAEQQAVALGKALNDPTKGLTALGRSGITFTEAEKEKIAALQESGDLLGAQEILLQAIESQVKGTAAATANTTDRLSQGWLAIKEELAGPVSEAFDKVGGFIADKIIPAVIEFIQKLKEGGSPLEGFTDKVLPLVKSFMELFTAASPIGLLIKSLLPIVTDLAQELGPVLKTIIDALVPVLKDLGAVIGQTLQTVFTALAPVILKVVQALAPLIVNVLTLIAPLIEALVPVVEKIIGLFTFLAPIFINIAGIIAQTVIPVVGFLIKVFTGFITNITNVGDTFKRVFNGVASFFKGIANTLINIIEGLVNFWIKAVNGIISGINLVAGPIGKIIGQDIKISTIPELNIPRLAKGGLVMPQRGGVLANLAEAGKPEVVIPLDRFESMMEEKQETNGETIVFNNYASPAISNEAELEKAVKRARLRRG
jgi:hypothetical protein